MTDSRLESTLAPLQVPLRARDRRRPWELRRQRLAAWETAVLVGGVGAALVAVVTTLQAEFLAYPGWLAVQKADLILGPIGVGLYWRRRRPQSPFGPMLIAFGFVHVPYVLQSSSDSVLFTIGVHWEGLIYLATLAVVLAFPTGRLRRLDWIVVGVAAMAVVAPSSALTLFSPQTSAGGSVSACRAACPENALWFDADPTLITRLLDVDRLAIIAVALATAGLLAWRFLTGTPPQRRALAIGTPIALVFLLTQATYVATTLLAPLDPEPATIVRWTFAVARSALWYGFLLALVAAQLFAGRVLRQIVTESLRRPSLGELETLLRRPLGDPDLRLAFWRPAQNAWVDGAGAVVEAPSPGSGRTLTVVEQRGAPAAAIVHDAQLADDPELLRAAGAAALLAAENAKLETAWNESMQELHTSRARLATASTHERRKLERDLHDGAQLSLVGIAAELTRAIEASRGARVQAQLLGLRDDVERTIEELRDLAHGIYPRALGDLGLVAALKAVAWRVGGRISVDGDGVGRYPSEIESAVYYCCREAEQNAIKHAGRDAHVAIRLRDTGDALHFEVRDDGHGFDAGARHRGGGLRNIEDRIAALDGRIEIASAEAGGVVVSGSIPLRHAVRRSPDR